MKEEKAECNVTVIFSSCTYNLGIFLFPKGEEAILKILSKVYLKLFDSISLFKLLM